MVECQLPKLKVAGSNPVSRSKKIKDLADRVKSFFVALAAFVSVFVSVWRKKHPEKKCAIVNIFETRIRIKSVPCGLRQQIYSFLTGIDPEERTGTVTRWTSQFSYLSPLYPFLYPFYEKDIKKQADSVDDLWSQKRYGTNRGQTIRLNCP